MKLEKKSRVAPPKDTTFVRAIYTMLGEIILMDMPGETYSRLDLVLKVLEAYLEEN